MANLQSLVEKDPLDLSHPCYFGFFSLPFSPPRLFHHRPGLQYLWFKPVVLRGAVPLAFFPKTPLAHRVFFYDPLNIAGTPCPFFW